jgi:hypothetical protein
MFTTCACSPEAPSTCRTDFSVTAQWISNVGVGLFVVGAVTPMVAGRISLAGIVFAAIYGGLGWTIHRYARDLLGDLQ